VAGAGAAAGGALKAGSAGAEYDGVPPLDEDMLLK